MPCIRDVKAQNSVRKPTLEHQSGALALWAGQVDGKKGHEHGSSASPDSRRSHLSGIGSGERERQRCRRVGTEGTSSRQERQEGRRGGSTTRQLLALISYRTSRRPRSLRLRPRTTHLDRRRRFRSVPMCARRAVASRSQGAPIRSRGPGLVLLAIARPRRPVRQQRADRHRRAVLWLRRVCRVAPLV